MKFQIEEIEFDFDDSASYDKEPEYFQTIIDETIDTIWEIDDEEDLVDEISDATGWCIKSIDYSVITEDN